MTTIDSRKLIDSAYAHLISDEDYEALDLVINNPLHLATKDLNFGEIITTHNVKVELSEKDPHPRTYSIDASAIRTRLEELKKQHDVVYKKLIEVSEELHRLSVNDQWDEELGLKCQYLEAEVGKIYGGIRALENLLKKDIGEKIVVEEKVLGEFISSPHPTVVLYYKNIQESSRGTVSGLVPVFVHEMFHAWNYFEANSKDRSVMEIDEAMVEFATIYFLDSLAESLARTDREKASQIFKRADCQKRNVRNKKAAVGSTAAYGFGSCLADKVKAEAPLWLEAYAAKSASLKPGDLKVANVLKALVPFYPFDSEDLVLKQLEEIIFGKGRVRCKTVTDKAKIIEVLTEVSPAVVGHIKANPTADYKLFSKEITHSDLCGGKRTKKTQGNDENILYYLTVSQMDSMGLDKVAHQSNIVIPKDVYDALSIKKVSGVAINFQLANDSAVYFTPSYSMKVVHTLGKEFPWQPSECTYTVASGPFTSMHMTIGPHGVGTSNDPEFQALRKNIFVDDVIYFLVETIGSIKNLYIMLSKAEKFYDILKIPTPVSGTETLEEVPEAEVKEVNTTEAAPREMQEAWKELLAQEMMRHASSETEVFCPLTRIRGTYENLKMLFIASHIKAYADCDEHEKFDVNNGLLLSAGADALFDKYMITIGEDKEIIFSYLIDHDDELKKAMRLDQEVFKQIFTPERMEYVKVHRQKFFEKEKERRIGVPSEDDNLVETAAVEFMSAEEILKEHSVNLKRDNLLGSCLPHGSKGTFLIAPYENILHKKWIIKNKMYNTLITKSAMQGATVESYPDTIVLYDKYDFKNLVAYCLNDCRYQEGKDMNDSPQAVDESQIYLVYTFDKACQINVDVEAISRYIKENHDKDASSQMIFINN